MQAILLVYTFESLKIHSMKTLSLKLDEPVYAETDRIVSRLKKTRNRYINEAIDFYNVLHRKNIIGKQLKKESKLVQGESMKVLAEFEKLHEKD